MLLDFENEHTNFSWGRNNIQLDRMDWIGAASLRHGFQALGLESETIPSLATA
jgi:fatty aldehyde-generating acyl-ACP reductase